MSEPWRSPESLEKRKLYRKIYYQINKKKINALNAQRYSVNKEHHKILVKRWYLANREKCKDNQKRWYLVNKEKRSRQNQTTRLYRRYGVTCEWFDQQLILQNGRCGICGEAPTKSKNLHIDHDHYTNKARGLLCTNCNTTLGGLERLGFSVVSEFQKWSTRGK